MWFWSLYCPEYSIMNRVRFLFFPFCNFVVWVAYLHRREYLSWTLHQRLEPKEPKFGQSLPRAKILSVCWQFSIWWWRWCQWWCWWWCQWWCRWWRWWWSCSGLTQANKWMLAFHSTFSFHSILPDFLFVFLLSSCFPSLSSFFFLKQMKSLCLAAIQKSFPVET